ncbi:MAG TPA: hypothetical protein VLE23_14685 [Geminicoccaceae bacterium]|nr:hypothetical protein [Geminicoccaceae bacterium]
MRGLLLSAGCVLAMAAGPALAQSIGTAAPFEQLIERFNAGTPDQDRVAIDAWTESGPEGSEVVIVIAPRGKTKLVADPGITVTPTARAGVEWRTPLPHRKVDPALEYFTPPATLRLPFTSNDDQPLELLVEYAWCVVDFQCFFGEEVLTVASRSP